MVILNAWSRSTKATLGVNENQETLTEQEYKILAKSKKRNGLELTGIGFAVGLILTSAVSFYFGQRELGKAWNSMIVFSNSAFGSRLIPTAILGIFGWFMVQLWDVANIRREKPWRDKLDAQQRQIARQIRTDKEKRRESDLKKLNREREELREAELALWVPKQDADADPLMALKRQVVDHIDQVRISIVRDQSVLEDLNLELSEDTKTSGEKSKKAKEPKTIEASEYLGAFKWKPKTLAKSMMNDELIEGDKARDDLEKFFTTWGAIKSPEDVSEDQLRELLNFHAASLRYLETSSEV